MTFSFEAKASRRGVLRAGAAGLAALSFGSQAQPGWPARLTIRSRSGCSRRSPAGPPASRPAVMLSSTQNTSNTGDIPTPQPAACASPSIGTAFTRVMPALST